MRLLGPVTCKIKTVVLSNKAPKALLLVFHRCADAAHGGAATCCSHLPSKPHLLLHHLPYEVLGSIARTRAST